MVRSFVRPRWLTLIAFSTLAVMASAAPASANHSWGGYHWARTSNPFTLRLGDNVSAQWKTYLATTSSDWSKSTVLDTIVVPGSTSAPRPCKARTGRVEVCSGAYGYNGWLGVASISLSGSHITAGTVKVNDSYFASSTYNKPEWRNLVMCQEVGHTLGLDHQDTNFDNTNLGTCMDYTSSPLGPPDNEHPNQHDYDELVTIYTHLDSSTTVGATVQSIAAQSGDDVASWGRSLGDNRYERDFGNGQRVVTFVIPA